MKKGETGSISPGVRDRSNLVLWQRQHVGHRAASILDQPSAQPQRRRLMMSSPQGQQREGDPFLPFYFLLRITP